MSCIKNDSDVKLINNILCGNNRKLPFFLRTDE